MVMVVVLQLEPLVLCICMINIKTAWYNWCWYRYCLLYPVDFIILLEFFITFVGSPNFVIWLNNATVVEGENATFNCSAESIPQPTITWYKSNSSLQPEASHIKFSRSNQTVTIINARRTDAGIYKCIAQNKINRTSAIAILDVQCKYLHKI